MGCNLGGVGGGGGRAGSPNHKSVEKGYTTVSPDRDGKTLLRDTSAAGIISPAVDTSAAISDLDDTFRDCPSQTGSGRSHQSSLEDSREQLITGFDALGIHWIDWAYFPARENKLVLPDLSSLALGNELESESRSSGNIEGGIVRVEGEDRQATMLKLGGGLLSKRRGLKKEDQSVGDELKRSAQRAEACLEQLERELNPNLGVTADKKSPFSTSSSRAKSQIEVSHQITADQEISWSDSLGSHSMIVTITLPTPGTGFQEAMTKQDFNFLSPLHVRATRAVDTRPAWRKNDGREKDKTELRLDAGALLIKRRGRRTKSEIQGETKAEGEGRCSSPLETVAILGASSDGLPSASTANNVPSVSTADYRKAEDQRMQNQSEAVLEMEDQIFSCEGGRKKTDEVESKVDREAAARMLEAASLTSLEVRRAEYRQDDCPEKRNTRIFRERIIKEAAEEMVGGKRRERAELTTRRLTSIQEENCMAEEPGAETKNDATTRDFTVPDRPATVFGNEEISSTNEDIVHCEGRSLDEKSNSSGGPLDHLLPCDTDSECDTESYATGDDADEDEKFLTIREFPFFALSGSPKVLGRSTWIERKRLQDMVRFKAVLEWLQEREEHDTMVLKSGQESILKRRFDNLKGELQGGAGTVAVPVMVGSTMVA